MSIITLIDILKDTNYNLSLLPKLILKLSKIKSKFKIINPILNVLFVIKMSS